MRWPFGKLRKSQSIQENVVSSTKTKKGKKSAQSSVSIADQRPGTANGELHHHQSGFGQPWRFRSTESALAGGSCCGEESRFDAELDRSMMQTINDVKYVNRRPKFTAVVDANFQRQCLEAHNIVRQTYGSPTLVWSQELADLAKAWALKLAERGRGIIYPELSGIGENILLVTYTTSDHLTTGSELTSIWASEAEHFYFDNPRWTMKTSHFTQLLWRSSIEMGVARFWNTTQNCLAIVALYRPGGNSNAPGEFAINLPSKAEVPDDALMHTRLDSLIHSMNRSTLNDGGFKPMKKN